MSHATIEGRNIWKEVEDGIWDVIGMGPEMMQMAPIAHLLQSKRFCKRLGFIFIDEVHLIDEWGRTFRKDFLRLAKLRSRVNTDVTFLSMSATLHDDNRRKIQRLLGFAAGQFHNVKLELDRTDLMYCPRFLSQSIEGPTFPDLAWTLPDIVHGPQDLPRILFTCNTINKVTILHRWLVIELKYRLQCDEGNNDELVKQMVQPFHSLIDDGDRRAILAALEGGSVCYVVTTTCANIGIDMTVTTVICVDIPCSFEEMVQWGGRASRDGSGGMLVVYASKDLKRVSEEE